MATVLCRGRLLVAAPSMQDPNFSRTVLLVVAHSAEGAVGVVLNRPSSMRVDEALPRLAPVAAPEVLFMGGPVGDGALLALGAQSGCEEIEGVEEILTGVELIPLGEEGTPGCSLERARLFVDYAGWSPGQLEAEINRGDWVVVDALPGDAFTPDPDALWATVLRRQAGRLAWLANAPRDPACN